MGEGGKERGVASADPPQPQYGTFQGVANYPPPPPPHPHPQPVIGFPPPSASLNLFLPQAPPYANAYQGVPGYAVAEGRPVPERRLPCCGCGCGWFLFIIGFFLGAIPWYVGAVILLCVRTVDYREKPGYIACTIAAVLATIAIIVGATSADW
ncbi:60S ribosomal protein L18a-like protein [Camellia sinensis]|uniref:60S ribosomal protein L18a-like protein n=1 Tax=Camellia sinensis TaxID=4442 RepID=UPI0010359742|nr:60S ribosomal protein L18a-like protein [Camellia sinensis]